MSSAADMERLFRKTWAGWPTFLSDSHSTAWRAWLALRPDDRRAAAERAPRYVALCGEKGANVCAFAVYLGDGRWKDVPEAPEAQKPAYVTAAPFGRLWAAARMEKLLAGPQPGAAIPALTASQRMLVETGQADEGDLMREKVVRCGFPMVNALHEAAAAGRPVSVPSRLDHAAAVTEQVRVGGERWRDWEAEHARRGWPWVPDPGRVKWVYFPAGGPACLGAFEAAIRGEAKDHDGGEREAAE